jgi:uncharacterized protein YjeT (DUF2065 family)
MNEVENRKLAPSQRRLQREEDFTGSRLSSFREVALRHGLPGALLGLACFALPGAWTMLQTGLSQATENPLRVVVVSLAIFIGLNLYAWYIDRSWRVEKAGWVVYLGAVSAWEEWVFRLALPYFAVSSGATLMTGVIVSNLIFAAAHYFTLRWKWQWCLLAFIGGVALSRQFADQENLMLIIFIHWVATFINTPRLPGSSQRDAAD